LELIDKHDLNEYFYTSAKTGYNIIESFDYLIEGLAIFNYY